MAIQTINDGEMLKAIRTKLNQNFSEAETIGNKTQVISSTPSTTKYPSEKAVADFSSRIYSSLEIPLSKSGDLLLHRNAPYNTTQGTKGKIKYNLDGFLSEFVPDRTVLDCRSSSAFTSANPVPLFGELVIESDTGKQKLGDGRSDYRTLDYLIGATEGENTYGGVDDAGWIKFPNGMILQWGAIVVQTDVYERIDKLVTLPTIFTRNRVYSHGVLQKGVDWRDSQLMVHSRFFSNSQLRFVAKALLDEPLGSLALYELHWIALGF